MRPKPLGCEYGLCIYPRCHCAVAPPPRRWDEGEHEGCGIDSQRALDRETLKTLTIQNIECHAHIRDLEEALQILERVSRLVVQSWEHAHIDNEPMIDALVTLSEALAALAPAER